MNLSQQTSEFAPRSLLYILLYILACPSQSARWCAYLRCLLHYFCVPHMRKNRCLSCHNTKKREVAFVCIFCQLAFSIIMFPFWNPSKGRLNREAVRYSSWDDLATPIQLLLLMNLQIKCLKGDIWLWQNYFITLISLESVQTDVLSFGVIQSYSRLLKDTAKATTSWWLSCL